MGGIGQQPPGARHCYQAGSVLIGLIEALIAERARDGVVEFSEVQRVLKRLQGGTEQLDRAFQMQEDRCRRNLWKRGDACCRENPFRRLMVRPFETLLTGDPVAFPRHFLPNYFQVVDAAFGDKLGEYEKQCRAVFQTLMVRHGNALSWEDFYADGRTWRILDHALKRLMSFLEGPAGQWVWVQTMSQPTVEGHKATAEQTDSVRAILSATWQGLMLEQGGPPRKTATGR
ncbi:MAG: hypothetical protein AB1918_01640 [Pseudomonadota bacterium]